MTRRPVPPPEFETLARSAEDGDDSIEFAEFTDDGDDSAGTEASDAATGEVAAAPPVWFRRKPDESSIRATPEDVTGPAFVVADVSVSDQATSRKRKRRKPERQDRPRLDNGNAGPPLVAPTEDEPPIDWKKDWKKLALVWLVSNASRGYGVSLIVHTILLGGMSAVIFRNLDDNQAISMIITDSDSMAVEFEEVMDLTMESAGKPQNPLPQLQKFSLQNAESALNSEMLTSAAQIAGGDGESGEPDDGLGFRFAMPQGGKAVSKGSFSAWTVPEDPEPRKDYMIVIRIRLPDKTKLYRITDLSGKVEGSDAYEQYLPFDPNRKDLVARTERGGQIVNVRANDRLRVINNHVQIMIPVKGAGSLVRDTIEVKSRMLKEEQRLEIVF